MTAEVDPRLEAQRKLLDELLRRYTDLHPDVVATKRLIVRLEDERQRELDAKRATAESRPVKQSVALNPVMQQVRLAMAEADGSVAALRVRVADTQGRLGQMRASASRVPQVEAELTQLNRDYDVIRRAYETMVARREKASLSEDVDATRPAQFRVIDPPRTTPQPVFPNRLALAPVVLLLALVAGLGTAFLLVQLRPTYSNARALRFATQRIVLGSVSMMIDAGMLRRKRLDLFAFGSTACAFLLVGGAWVAWVAMQVRA